MSKYVVSYDELFDEMIQFEVSDKEAEQLISVGWVEVWDTPRSDIPVTSRYRSERHPGWGE